jgi:hypothetical protein
MKKAKETAAGLFKSTTWKKAVSEDKSSWAETIAQTVTDVGLGLTGALVGSYLRVAALPVGVGLNVWANKSGLRWLRSASIGMMTSPLDEQLGINTKTAKAAGVNLKDEMETSKEHMKSYLSQLKSKFFLDKIFKGKNSSQSSTVENSTPDTSTPPVNGLGIDPKTFDALEAYEQQVISHAVEHEATKSQKTATDAVAYNSSAFVIEGLDDLDTPHVI